MAADRKHFFDASRALLMFLGIPLHAADVYRPGSDFLVRSPETNAVLGVIEQFVHTFRIGAFFIIAGYFSLLLLRRSDGATWFRGRLLRLGVPVLTFALLVNLPQELIRLRFQAPGMSWAEAGSLLLQHPDGVVLHLWFLVDLIVMSAGAALLWDARNRRHVRAAWHWIADAVVERPRAAIWLGLPALGLVRLFAEGTSFVLGPHRLDLWGIIDVHRIVGTAPLFAVGVLLAARPELLARMLRVTKVSAAAAVALCALTVAVARHGHAGAALAFTLMPIDSVLMAHVIFGAAHRVFDRPRPRVLWLAQSSFTVYLVHHPVVVGLAFALLGVHASPIAEFALITAVTTAIAIGAHAVVRTSPTLLFLVNGVVERPAPLPRATLADS